MSSLHTLSKEQVEELKETFDLFDKDKSGGIDRFELESVLFSLGYQMTKAEVTELFNKIDTDKSGTIDFKEFADMMLQKRNAGQLATEEEEITAAFKLFDVDGNGTITSDELRAIMNNLGADLKKEEVELLIKEADYDGNGELSLEEFTTFMLSK